MQIGAGNNGIIGIPSGEKLLCKALLQVNLPKVGGGGGGLL